MIQLLISSKDVLYIGCRSLMWVSVQLHGAVQFTVLYVGQNFNVWTPIQGRGFDSHSYLMYDSSVGQNIEHCFICVNHTIKDDYSKEKLYLLIHLNLKKTIQLQRFLLVHNPFEIRQTWIPYVTHFLLHLINFQILKNLKKLSRPNF